MPLIENDEFTGAPTATRQFATSDQLLREVEVRGLLPQVGDKWTLTVQLDWAEEYPHKWFLDLVWPREIDPDTIVGAAGQRCPVQDPFGTSLKCRGLASIHLHREESHRIRLRVQPDCGTVLADVEEAPSATPENLDLLRLTFFGFRAQDLMLAALRDYGSRQWISLADEIGVEPTSLQELADVWESLGLGLQAYLWDVASDEDRFLALRTETRRLLPQCDGRMPDWQAVKQACLTEGGGDVPEIRECLLASVGELPGPDGDPRLAARCCDTLRRVRTVFQRDSYELILLHQKRHRSTTGWCSLLKSLAADPDRLTQEPPAIRRQISSLLGKPEESSTFLSNMNKIDGWVAQLWTEGRERASASLQERASMLERLSDPLIDAVIHSDEECVAWLRSNSDRPWTGLPALPLHSWKSPGRLDRLKAPLTAALRLPLLTAEMVPLADNAVCKLPEQTGGNGPIDLALGPMVPQGDQASKQLHIERVLASCCLNPESMGKVEPWNMQACWQAKLDTPLLRSAWDRVSQHYTMGAPIRSWYRQLSSEQKESATATFFLEMPGDHLQAWAHMPGIRELTFFESFAPMGFRLQKALRAWVPAVALETSHTLYKPLILMPLNLYGLTRPFAGKPKACFSWDPMCDEHIGIMLRSGTRKFMEWFREMIQEFKNEPDPNPVLVEMFRERNLNRTIAHLRRNLRNTRLLMTADAAVIEEFVHLADRTRELGRYVKARHHKALKAWPKFRDETLTSLQKRLRHLYTSGDYSGLVPILLMEASCALPHRAGETACMLDARLVLEAAGNRKEFRGSAVPLS